MGELLRPALSVRPVALRTPSAAPYTAMRTAQSNTTHNQLCRRFSSIKASAQGSSVTMLRLQTLLLGVREALGLPLAMLCSKKQRRDCSRSRSGSRPHQRIQYLVRLRWDKAGSSLS